MYFIFYNFVFVTPLGHTTSYRGRYNITEKNTLSIRIEIHLSVKVNNINLGQISSYKIPLSKIN